MKAKRIIGYIFAENENLSLADRLFVSAILIGWLISIFSLIITLFLLSALVPFVISVVLIVLLSVVYYFARFKGIIEPFKFPVILISFAAIAIIWIFGAGMNGQNMLSGLLVLILSMIMVERRKQAYVFIICISCIVFLYFLQYYRPELIHDYPNETQRWADSFLTTLFVSLCIYWTIRYFHKYYMIENRRAEENERDFRALSENSQDHIARYDRQHRHTYMNQSGIEFTGLPAGEIIGKTHKEMGVFKEKTGDQWEEIIENVFLTKLPYTEQIKTQYKNQDVYFEWRLFPEFNDKNEVVSVLGITHDITVLKRSELKMQKLNSEKDKFYSVLAHDLRSPFSGLCGLTEILADELPDMPVGKAQEMATAIKKSASGIYNLLVDLLDWSRINQGLIQYNPERLQLLPVIADTILLVQDRLNDKNIQASTDCTEDLEVFADRYMLQVIIRNLVTNAVKFTPQKGRITIAADSLENNNVEISVADTGIGMSKAILDNLFRIDIQTARRGTDGEPSTGIGLLLCNEFILKHGGALSVESEEGKGSRFSFTLPSGL